MARVRADVGKHVKDIAERYLLPGETQDIALMFVPSESIYSDLVEHFDDVVQKAHRARVVIVSPSLMMMAIQVDADDRARRAHARRSARDPGRGRQAAQRRAPARRARRQARDAFPPGAGGPCQIVAPQREKIARRGERIEAMDFSREGEPAPPDLLRLARGAE